MADGQDHPEGTETESLEAVRDANAPRGVRDLWQVPVLIVGLGVLGSGMYSGWVHRPRPDVDQKLDRASAIGEAGDYAGALDYLNTEVRSYTGSQELFPDDRRGRFHLLRARMIDLAQRGSGISVASNHERVLSELSRAEKLLGELTPEDELRRARALAALDRPEDAWEALNRAPAGPRRTGVRRELIEARLDLGDLDRSLAWLAELGEDPAVRPDDEAWIAARRAETRLAQGFFDDTITKLLRELPRLQDAGEAARGELFLILGEAYALTGDPARAGEQFERADALLPDSDELSARVLLGEARLLRGDGDLDRARERYDRIVSLFGSSKSYLPALLGLAELDAQLDDHAAAAATYGRAVDEQLTVAPGIRVAPATVWRAVIEQGEARLAAGDSGAAIGYAEVLGPMFVGVEEMPTSLIRLIAHANATRAEEIAASAVSAEIGLLDLADVDPVTRNAARERFVRAGTFFGHLADRVVLTDDAEHADAWWGEARAFDLAGDQDRAIRALTRFVEGYPDHSRRAEARYRLARAHLSRGEYAKASELYAGLISEGSDGREAGGSPGGVGLYAALSYPALARAYVLDTDPSNDSAAEGLLLDVLRGRLGGPESPVYVDALAELARLYYNAGRLPEAIERLEEAVDRTRGEARSHQLRYRLADARRREAEAIERTLEEDLSQQERVALEDMRREHLRKAIEAYDLVRDGFEAIDPRRRGPTDELFLRNAYFFSADCEFDLGDLEGALTRYSAARERYPDDPASLVAMMQIFNAYVRLGEYDLARTAGQRARRFYESLDDAVWDDPLLPLTREDWERWLDASYELAQTQTQAQAGGDP